MWHLPTAIPPAWGAWAVFVSVLITQLGLPFPAAPMLILAGSMVALGQASFLHSLFAAVAAVLIADSLWFIAGRLYGRRMLNSLVRFSLSLDNTVRFARDWYERFGAPLLAISKFVPGLGLVSSPLMGTTSVDVRVFLFWDMIGGALWASLYLLGGAAFDKEIMLLSVFVRNNGGTAMEAVAGMFLCLALYRWIRRLQFRKWLAQIRITPVQLAAAMRSDAPPMIFDARPEAVRRKEPHRIPGARRLDLNAPGKLDLGAEDQPIVIYCVCPNEATAKQIVMQLHRKGIYHVHALRGGLDAWEKAGFPVEPIPLREEVAVVTGDLSLTTNAGLNAAKKMSEGCVSALGVGDLPMAMPCSMPSTNIATMAKMDAAARRS